MVEKGDGQGGEDEVPYDTRYATAVEVDGLRRTVDSFMRKQEEHNDTMALNLDQIMCYMTKLGTKIGVSAPEDKASNAKGTNFSEAIGLDIPPATKPDDTQVFKSTHLPNHAGTTANHNYVPPPYGTVYYYDPDELDWLHRKPHTPPPKIPTPNPPPKPNYFQQQQAYHDVEYMWDDCPWSIEEIEAFNPFPTHPPKTTPQPHFANNLPHRQYTQPVPQNNVPQTHNLFNNQLQSQHRMVAKGPKLSFPEFDGTDPDGWIRKAEKYFDLVGVSSEERVQLAVLYIKGKAEYWWRSTGGSSATTPWHQFCRMIGDRFNDTSTYEAIGKFHSLKQMGTVTDYIDKFEEIMGLVKRDNPTLLSSSSVN